MVELKVSCMHYIAFRCFDTDSDGIRNTVISLEEGRFQCVSELYFRIRMDQNPFRLTKQVRFSELVFHESERQFRSVYRNIQVFNT